MRCLESPDVLSCGQWVNARGIQRWVPEPEPAPPILTLVPEPPRELDIRELIACPTCHATVTEFCRRKDGTEEFRPHAHRLVPRRCVCGMSVPKYRRFCRFCRAEKRAESCGRYETKRRAS